MPPKQHIFVKLSAILTFFGLLLPLPAICTPLVSLDSMDCKHAMMGRPRLMRPNAGPWLRRTRDWAVLKLALIDRKIDGLQLALSERYAEGVEKFNSGLQEGFGLNKALAPGPRELDQDWLREYFGRLQEMAERFAEEARASGMELTLSAEALRTSGELIEPNGAIVIRFSGEGAFEFVTPIGQLRIFEQDIVHHQFKFFRMMIDKFGLRVVDWPAEGQANNATKIFILDRDPNNRRYNAAVRMSLKESQPTSLKQVERWGLVKPIERRLIEPKLGGVELGNGVAPEIVAH